MHVFDVESFLRESAAAIWDRKMLGRITDLYAPHALVHIGGGEDLHGARQVLDRAVLCLAAFPDLRVFIDDIICAGRGAVYRTAVRWTAVARNAGPSVYGPATGRRVVVSGITISRIERGQFVEQWIELGDGDLVRQLGLDEQAVLRRHGTEEAASDFDTTLDHGALEGPAGDADAARPPTEGAPADAGALVGVAAEAIWNRRQIGEVERFYTYGYRQRGPGGRTLFGREELQTEIVALIGAFPDLRMHIDDVFWDDDQRAGCRASTRWTLLGTNLGPSALGPPTGAWLRLSGITTYRVTENRFVEGWTAYSELSLARRLVRLGSSVQTDTTETA